MKTIQIFQYPSCLVREVKKNDDWSIDSATTNPEHNPKFSIKYKGEIILHVGRGFGMGFDSNVGYPNIDEKFIPVIKSLLGNKVGVIQQPLKI
jgi:hypothetical protein